MPDRPVPDLATADEAEQLLASPDPIPLEDVPNGLLNRVDGLLAIKDTVIARLRQALNEVITNGEWVSDGENGKDWLISPEVYALVEDALAGSVSTPTPGGSDG